MRSVSNFGRNIRFTPRHRYKPQTEDEVLQLLNEHRDGTVRVVGARHSWNPGIETPDALVDVRHFRHVRVHDSRTRVTVGAGCRIGALLKHLTRRGLTLPSIGLIDRQTVAGAVATGTHGSGRHSMSHYVQSMRIACYGANGNARVLTVDSGPMLRAARCSVGALGVVLEVTLACVPQYYVRERCAWSPSLDAVLEKERDAPLQQFYLMPHAWRVLAHQRSVADENRRRGGAALYRVYWLATIDVRLHLLLKFSA
ncbi:FAD-binding protein, partial [Candidatus Palauibacter sp.]|uniref:FAD-binding protein n=1 Tax=Candidatus Palauibacter sp. TaxID=3101350 RepID=UPI003AF25D83